MNKITAIIIDDEVKASENLEILIQTYCTQLEIVAIYNNPLQAIEGVKALKPNLLFLDVEMPHYDGFQLLELVNGSNEFKVIFTTAFKDYAFDAIKHAANDFLLKPIDIKELIFAVNKIENVLIDKKKVETEKVEIIKIASLNGFDLISINEINYLKSNNNTTEICYLHEGIQKKVMATKSIKQFEDTLSGYSFFRIHDSYIVNLNKIKQYIKGEGGTIVLFDGTEIEVARRKKQEFLNKFLN